MAGLDGIRWILKSPLDSRWTSLQSNSVKMFLFSSPLFWQWLSMVDGISLWFPLFPDDSDDDIFMSFVYLECLFITAMIVVFSYKFVGEFIGSGCGLYRMDWFSICLVVHYDECSLLLEILNSIHLSIWLPCFWTWSLPVLCPEWYY